MRSVSSPNPLRLNLISAAALDPRSANERLSREFEEVSANFFSGRPVEAE
jgi:hypothetical protein